MQFAKTSGARPEIVFVSGAVLGENVQNSQVRKTSAKKDKSARRAKKTPGVKKLRR